MSNYITELTKNNEELDNIPTTDKQFMVFWGMNFHTKRNNMADIKTVDFSFFEDSFEFNDTERKHINEICIGEAYKGTEDPDCIYDDFSVVRIK